MTGIEIDRYLHETLEERKEVVADVMGVPVRDVTFADAVWSFVEPEDWDTTAHRVRMRRERR